MNAGFGVLPVPTVPRGRAAVRLGIVYAQSPPAGTKLSGGAVTIFVRADTP
jgi:hypothetical protein